jgi:membrane protease YdiL (CAAX protease family)
VSALTPATALAPAFPPLVVVCCATAAAAGAAALAARAGGAAAIAVPVACAGLAWLLTPPARIARCLGPARTGWPEAAALAAAVWALPAAVTALVVEAALGGMLMVPAPGPAARELLAAAPAVASLALAEELLFRGALQQSVLAAPGWQRRLGPISGATAVAALSFGVTHLPSGGPVQAATAVVSGLVLGWVTERAHGSLWPAAALHAAANLAVSWNSMLLFLNAPLARVLDLPTLGALLLGGPTR